MRVSCESVCESVVCRVCHIICLFQKRHITWHVQSIKYVATKHKRVCVSLFFFQIETKQSAYVCVRMCSK